ncbi:MAG: very short patch repair endonuclease [Chloroflexota bacterium]
MRANRRRDTKPETRIRSALFAAGFRYRKDALVRAGVLKVHVDIVFLSRRLAVFVDGCFWHSCPRHGRIPSANAAYWRPKLEANERRDRMVDEALNKHGWTVLRLWEHVTTSVALEQVAQHLGGEARAIVTAQASGATADG